MKRNERLRSELDAHRFQQPLTAVWPAALRLLHDRQFDLVGNDRLYLGDEAQGSWGRMLAKGFETRVAPKGGLVSETNPNGAHLRYRVEGRDTGSGTCRITYTAVQRDADDPSEEEARDVDMELELVRRVDAAAAAGIMQRAEAGP
jgi:hypothetical protein